MSERKVQLKPPNAGFWHTADGSGGALLIGYARVSTEDQSLDRQTDALLGAWCERVYCDKESGMRGRRAELDRMLDALREGDTVCVVSIDRLGRSVRQVLALVEDLRRMGVGITSLKEGFQADTTPAASS